ncbi:twin-arginine translocase TatA/TatE family subunit [bacterium SCSIO 12643]|mgnify:CR=1 FL=1|nr:twin-arginine translocase TatA/TatE family subunit [bacterium SCSIO 12643]
MTNSIFLMGMPGGYEWIIIGVIILLLFGGRKLPELMKGMGKGIKEFKDASKSDDAAKELEEKK